VQATRSMRTRSRGGKDRWPTAALRIEHGFPPPLAVALPQIPESRPPHPQPARNLHDPLTAVQRQEGSGSRSNPLGDLTVSHDWAQPAPRPRA
jgi:hypothetical protein